MRDHTPTRIIIAEIYEALAAKKREIPFTGMDLGKANEYEARANLYREINQNRLGNFVPSSRTA